MQYLGKQSDGKDIVNIEYLENRVGEFLVPSDILSGGKIKSELMPASVDEILEFDRKADFPAQGEASKIYVDKQTNLTYRWGGSAYVEISPSIALGESEDTAYRGDRGKTAYDHSQTEHAVTIAGNKISSLGGNVSKETLISDLGISGKYEKPSGGIPKRDLASDVQGSLGKADSAVQPDAISDMETKTHASQTYATKTENDDKVSKSGDTMTGELSVNNGVNITNGNQLSFYDGGFSGSMYVNANHILKFHDSQQFNDVYHSGNANKSDVDWTAKSLDLYGDLVIHDDNTILKISDSIVRLISCYNTSWGAGAVLSYNPASSSMNFTGNVGIGTTNPQCKLDVNGKLKATDIDDSMIVSDTEIDNMINEIFA